MSSTQKVASCTCPPSVTLVAQDSANINSGGSTYVNNGSIYCGTSYFAIYPQYQNPTGDPCADFTTPCIMTSYNLYYTNHRVRGTETFYEGGNAIGCVGPSGCVLPIGGTVPPASGISIWTLTYSGMDATQSHDITFSKIAGAWNTTTVTVQNCWDNTPIPSTVSTPVSWASATPDFTVSIPANTNIGLASYSVTPAAPGAFVDTHSGYLMVNPNLLTAATTYTVTYSFTQPLCTIQGTFVFTKGLVPMAAVNSPTICLGDSVTLTASGGSSYNWQPGGQNTPTITVTPTLTTSYTVAATSSVCPGTSTATAVVTVNNCGTGLTGAMQNEKVKIFPNPSAGNFSIEAMVEPGAIYLLEVQNTLGQIVHSEKIVPKSSQLKKAITLNDRTKGVYLLTLQNGSTKMSHRLVIE